MTRPPPARNPDVVHSQLTGGQVVLLHLESGAYHELNPTGAAIWELLDGDRTTVEIATTLQERVDDPPDDLVPFVTDFLRELRERDLIR